MLFNWSVPKYKLNTLFLKRHLGLWHTLAKICKHFDDQLNSGDTLIEELERKVFFFYTPKHGALSY